MGSHIRVGIVLRSFARTADKTASTAERVIKALEQVAWYRQANWMVSTILVLVPSDKQYKDSDAGELTQALRQGWLEYKDSIDEGGHAPIPQAMVAVRDVSTDLFVGLQNYAIEFFQHEHHSVDIMITAAPSAINSGYLREETVELIISAFMAGAMAASVMVPEDGIDELVARGTAGGPIMAWAFRPLVEVGGFNQAAAQPKVGEENTNAGVEEIHPLVKIMRQYGQCYAPIIPVGVSFTKRTLEGEDLVRHQKQIHTKTDRQLAHARSLGIESLDFFAEHVMPQFRVQTTD